MLQYINHVISYYMYIHNITFFSYNTILQQFIILFIINLSHIYKHAMWKHILSEEKRTAYH